MSEPLRITLPMPPSVNHAYATVKGRRVLSRDGRTYKRGVGLVVAVAAIDAGFSVPADARLGLTLALHFENNRRQDVSNRVKILEDVLSEALNFDDCAVDVLHVERKENDKSNPRCEVRLEVLR